MWFDKRRDPRPGDEVRFHRDRLIEDYMAAGMDRADAERRALLALGSVPQIEEAVRDVRGRWADDLIKDLQYALRSLRRNPGFSAVAILSLALGIGANTAIFSLVNAVMLRTLPVDEPGRLVQLTRLLDGRPGSVNFPLFEHLRDNVRSISGAFVQATTEQAIVIDGEEEFVKADLVSGGYFTVLGLEPVAGRLLGPADDSRSSSSPAAVIADHYWNRRFARSPAVIGRTFTLRDRVFTIVGVTPASYRGAAAGRAPDVFVPLLPLMEPQQSSPGYNWLNLMARLKPGATVEQANAEVQVLFGAFLKTLAAEEPEKERAGILRQRAAALPAPDGVNPFRVAIAQPLTILMGIVGLILMLACVNLSGLLLARAASRQREISIRLAIGASRGRLVRQFLTESLVLAAIGGGMGFLCSIWFSARLAALFINGRAIEVSTAPDWRVLAFTAVVSVTACLLAGLAPALKAVRVNVSPTLKEVRAHGHGRLGKALVVVQLAISMILVVGATLFVGTLVKLYAVDRGFNSDGVLVVSLRNNHRYLPEQAKAVQAALLERLRNVPGVQSVSAAQVLPVGGGLWTRGIQVEGYTFRADEPEDVGFNAIAPAYFATIGTPLLSGREFDERDTDAAPRVAMVNESFARYFFGNRSALGRRVTSVGVTYEIVGVVRDAKYQSLRDETIRTMYIPWMQREGEHPARYSYLVRAVAGDPMRLEPGMERLVREADPGLRLRSTLAYATLVERSLATERIMGLLGGLFGVLALVVAALGMFGVLAFQVARRTNELGVRMALGASRSSMIRLVLRDVVAMLVPGVAIGAGLALMVTGLAKRILFGLTPGDPGVFLVAAVVLVCAAALAAWLPANRAARVDPLVALRHE